MRLKVREAISPCKCGSRDDFCMSDPLRCTTHNGLSFVFFCKYIEQFCVSQAEQFSDGLAGRNNDGSNDVNSRIFNNITLLFHRLRESWGYWRSRAGSFPQLCEKYLTQPMFKRPHSNNTLNHANFNHGMSTCFLRSFPPVPLPYGKPQGYTGADTHSL